MRRNLGILVAAAALVSCASLLGLNDVVRPKAFPHRVHLFEGVGCFRCHPGLGKADAPGQTPSLHLPSAALCVECHQTPHRPEDCLSCHTEPGARERREQAQLYLRFSHAPHLPEVNMSCGRCHLGVPEDRPEPPTMATCLTCHKHSDAYQVRSCKQCHNDLPSEELRPASHAVHGQDFSARHGALAGSQRDYCATCHGETFCASCHGVSVPALAARLAFDQVTLGSSTLHRAGFRARHAEEARSAPGTCVSCHAPSSCNDCHSNNGVAAAGRLTRGPHPPSWVGVTAAENEHGRAARLDPVACASCHDGAGEQLCASCHSVGGVGGNVHPPGWQSHKRLSERPCRLCHQGVTR